MLKTKWCVAGLLMGAVAFGSGCKTMSNRDNGMDPAVQGTGGAGLDPNSDHNVPGSPMEPISAPINAPATGPDAPMPQFQAPGQ